MKKLIYIILPLLPLMALCKVPVPVVEQKYIIVLAKSVGADNAYSPRNLLYWSLCLGKKSALTKEELSNRIAALASDSVARIAFYKRLNFYRGYASDPGANKETYGELYLPSEAKERNGNGKGFIGFRYTLQ